AGPRKGPVRGRRRCGPRDDPEVTGLTGFFGLTKPEAYPPDGVHRRGSPGSVRARDGRPRPTRAAPGRRASGAVTPAGRGRRTTRGGGRLAGRHREPRDRPCGTVAPVAAPRLLHDRLGRPRVECTRCARPRADRSGAPPLPVRR